MTTLIFAVILTIVQTPPPVPGKAADHTAQSGGEVKQQTPNKDNPSREPSAVLQPKHPPTNQDYRNQTSSTDTVQTVNVREFPPVSITRNWADWMFWIFNGILAVAAIIGICYAYKTLCFIRNQIGVMERQTKATEVAAKAAQDNAQAAKENSEFLVGSERGWMVTRLPSMNSDRGKIVYSCFIQNTGKTPCRIVKMGIRISKTDSFAKIPLIPDYGEAKHFNQILVAPIDSIHTEKAELLLVDNEFQDVFSGKLFLYGYGFVRYLDIFARDERDIRETRFCHCSQAPEPGESGLIVRPCIEAPPEYHRAT